jgi:hypothetical protein
MGLFLESETSDYALLTLKGVTWLGLFFLAMAAYEALVGPWDVTSVFCTLTSFPIFSFPTLTPPTTKRSAKNVKVHCSYIGRVIPQLRRTHNKNSQPVQCFKLVSTEVSLFSTIGFLFLVFLAKCS